MNLSLPDRGLDHNIHTYLLSMNHSIDLRDEVENLMNEENDDNEYESRICIVVELWWDMFWNNEMTIIMFLNHRILLCAWNISRIEYFGQVTKNFRETFWDMYHPKRFS